jgi:hypothetical protein
MSIEEEYQDVLMSMESAIVGVYRDNPEMSDFQVDQALEALGRAYLSEKGGKQMPLGKPSPLPRSEPAQKVYQALKFICEWQLGREQIVDEEGQPMGGGELDVDEILACLKRLRKSVSLWNKQGGSQGYLKYISQFLK